MVILMVSKEVKDKASKIYKYLSLRQRPVDMVDIVETRTGIGLVLGREMFIERKMYHNIIASQPIAFRRHIQLFAEESSGVVIERQISLGSQP